MVLPPWSNTTSSASWVSPGAGITGGFDSTSESLRVFVVCCAALTIYNACELTVMIFLTFTRYRGLYFWSLLVAGLAVIPYSLGFLLKFANVTSGDLRWLAVVLLSLGWYPMITGQAVVLWSRLHLIVSGPRGDRIIRYTKWMIIVDAVVLHIPTSVLTFGSNGCTDTATFVTGYNVMEKIQMIGFFAQEVVLSSIYIVETVKILRVSLRPRTRTIMQQLVAINAVIIAMDLGLLGLECASLYIVEILVKGVIYSIKLKLEFAILGKLVSFVDATGPSSDPRTGSVGFITTAVKRTSDSTDQEMDPDESVDPSQGCSDPSRPRIVRPLESWQWKRRNCDVPGVDLEYDMARFEHIETVASLESIGPRGRPRSSTGVIPGDFLPPRKITDGAVPR